MGKTFQVVVVEVAACLVLHHLFRVWVLLHACPLCGDLLYNRTTAKKEEKQKEETEREDMGEHRSD